MSKPRTEIDHCDRCARCGGSDSVGTARAPGVSEPVLGRLVHDLRGPLSPLQTAAYLLRREDLERQRRDELLDIIDRQTLRLGSMLQEMSDWMRAREGSLVGHREPLDVPMLVEQACARLAAVGGSIDLPEALDELKVPGDAGHLVQMLGTLLSYMQHRAGEGGVRVVASLAEGRLGIVIERRDETPMSSLAQSSRTLFTQPEPVPFDEGLGLRLLIACATAQAHGGCLSAGVSASGREQLRIELPVV